MFHVQPDHFLILCFLALLAWAACSDALEFLIPNAASFGLVLLYPIHVLVSPIPIDWFWATVVAAAIFIPCLMLFAAGNFGGGDVKLLSAATLWAGPTLVLPMLVAIALAGGVLALVMWGAYRLRRRNRLAACGDISLTTTAYAPSIRLPYGVAIAAGASLAGLRLMSG
jgi:prepilin peptidase CpaA